MNHSRYGEKYHHIITGNIPLIVFERPYTYYAIAVVPWAPPLQGVFLPLQVCPKQRRCRVLSPATEAQARWAAIKAQNPRSGRWWQHTTEATHALKYKCQSHNLSRPSGSRTTAQSNNPYRHGLLSFPPWIFGACPDAYPIVWTQIFEGRFLNFINRKQLIAPAEHPVYRNLNLKFFGYVGAACHGSN